MKRTYHAIKGEELLNCCALPARPRSVLVGMRLTCKGTTVIQEKPQFLLNTNP
jgi:hypothetical protein